MSALGILFDEDVAGHATAEARRADAMSMIPTMVKFLKWSGRRASSAPLSAFVVAAIKSSAVKSQPE